MKGRKADARIGYFDSGRFDFSNDLDRTPRQRFVNRWRLEKKDPAAALSEPVKPIVYWIDRTVPVKYRPGHHRRRARVEQGVREDRLQERRPGAGPARRRRLRHPRPEPRLDPLDDQRLAGVRRDRPEPRRPAQRRDPRRRHRHREPVVAHHPRDPGPGADRRRRREPVRRAAAHRPRAASARLRPLLQLRRRGRRADGLRARRARGARRPRPRQPRGGGLRRGLSEGRDDARGRAHARPAPQLPLVACLSP